ncbi:hypothetical protein [Porphyromonas endodontalis]|uniref:hypothetical protein n=1 Tax=Porphyromonas endodontalis TaxID=28124 RepID=UPI0028E48C5B|nr:hypothetical protein [Porphyromonas endodontalis]
MKTIFASVFAVVALSMLVACSAGKNKENNQEKDSLEVGAPSYNYTNFTSSNVIAYQDSLLFFYNVDEDMTIPFHLLEPDEIFNFVFDPDGKTLYYTVVRDGMLWLRQATFGGEEPQLEDLVNLNIPKESSISETSLEHSRLMYKDGKLFIPNGFSWEAYCFTSFRVYTIASRKLQDADWDKYISLMEGGQDQIAQHFSTKSDQLYYRNGSKLVCVTDKLNLEEQKEEESIEYMQYSISPDRSKVAFGAMLMLGDVAHGPLCIANADGSQQQILVEDGVSDEQPTLWIGNRLFFIDVDDELTSENDGDCGFSLFTIDPSTNKRTRMFDRVRRFDIKQPAK